MKAALKKATAAHIRRHAHLRRRAAIRSPLPNGPATQFERDTDAPGCIESWPAATPVSPAADRIIDGDVFEADGDLYYVELVLPSTGGAQRDVLIIRGNERMRCDDRSARRAIQVRDIEQMIVEERIDFPFGPSAKQFNLHRGWGRGGRTLASLGIAFGGDA